MRKQDQYILRSTKQLARKECANYSDGCCLPEECLCHVINPAYKTIHDGAVDCDCFLSAVLPLQPELNTTVWHEVLRDADQAGDGWKECVLCHKPFIPGSNRQRYCADCGKTAKAIRVREKQRRYRARQKAPA